MAARPGLSPLPASLSPLPHETEGTGFRPDQEDGHTRGPPLLLKTACHHGSSKGREAERHQGIPGRCRPVRERLDGGEEKEGRNTWCPRPERDARRAQPVRPERSEAPPRRQVETTEVPGQRGGSCRSRSCRLSAPLSTRATSGSTHGPLLPPSLGPSWENQIISEQIKMYLKWNEESTDGAKARWRSQREGRVGAGSGTEWPATWLGQAWAPAPKGVSGVYPRSAGKEGSLSTKGTFGPRAGRKRPAGWQSGRRVIRKAEM